VIGDGDASVWRFEIIALLAGPSGWYDQNKLRIGRFYQTWFLRVTDNKEKTFSPEVIERADTAVYTEMEYRNPCAVLGRMLLPRLGQSAGKFAYAQSAVDMARIGCALERYRLAHGDYPEALAPLAPQFIEQVPHDVIGGEPLKYHRTDDGQFVLYSIGWNEKDDGGVVGYRSGSKTPDIASGDWVWRYPAK